MARPRKMTTEQMISVVDSYYATEAQGDEKRLKCSMIAAYAVELGYEAKGYDFARNIEVREHIERMKCYADVHTIIPQKGLVYKSLDVAGFLRNNKERLQLAKALTELDLYWKQVYEQAGLIVEQNRRLTLENNKQRMSIEEHTGREEKLKEENGKLTKLNNMLISENRYLRKMLRTYLYPAIANEILIRENVLKDAETYATDKAVEDMTELSMPKPLPETIKRDTSFQTEEEILLNRMWEMCDA